MPKKFGSEEEKREYNRNNMAKWRAANPEKVEAAKPGAAQRTAEWRAKLTDEEREASRLQTAKWRADFKARDPEGYRQYENERNKRGRDKLKLEVLAAYGGKCTCQGCTVTEPEFLTVHHIAGDGAAHRAELFPTQAKNRGGGGYRFWLWLKRNGWPRDNFALHCYNCNCSKGFYGYCPHERLAQRADVQHQIEPSSSSPQILSSS